MIAYEEQALNELQAWQQKMQQGPSLSNRIAKSLQNKINGWIPEKVHQVITVTIEKMVKATLFGIKYTTSVTLPPDASLLLRESRVKRQITLYQKRQP